VSCVQILLRTPQAIDVFGLYDRCPPPRKVPTSQREYITISQLSTSPALEELLDQFPLKLLGFHSDNGPEYINNQVADRYSQVNVNLVLLQAKHAHSTTNNQRLRANWLLQLHPQIS